MSAVSVHRALHSLEEGLRCPLFKREGRNLIPLKAAYAFAEHAQRAIDACEAGVKEARDVYGFNAPRLRIGSLYSLTLRCIPKIIIGLKLRKPTLDINLMLGSNQELLRGLDRGPAGRPDPFIEAMHRAHEDSDCWPCRCSRTRSLRRADRAPYVRGPYVDLADARNEKFVTLSDDFVTATALPSFQPCRLRARGGNARW